MVSIAPNIIMPDYTEPGKGGKVSVADPFGGKTLLKVGLRKNGAKNFPGSQYTIKTFLDYEKQGMGSVSNNRSGYFKIANHGGQCCGSKHLYPFPQYDPMFEYFLEQIVTGWYNSGANHGRNIEVTLTQRQCEGGGWPAALSRLGFRLVSVHGNTNSSNTVFIWHLSVMQPFHARPVWMDKLGIADPHSGVLWNKKSSAPVHQTDPRKAVKTWKIG